MPVPTWPWNRFRRVLRYWNWERRGSAPADHHASMRLEKAALVDGAVWRSNEEMIIPPAAPERNILHPLLALNFLMSAWLIYYSPHYLSDWLAVQHGEQDHVWPIVRLLFGFCSELGFLLAVHLWRKSSARRSVLIINLVVSLMANLYSIKIIGDGAVMRPPRNANQAR